MLGGVLYPDCTLTAMTLGLSLTCCINRYRFRNIMNFSKTFKNQARDSKWTLNKSENSECIAASCTPSLRSLLKPFVFTVSFTGCSFIGCTIWQYEEMRKLAKQQFSNNHLLSKFYGTDFKRAEIRRKLNSWWNSQSEGQKVASVIIGINVVVFCLWRIPALYPLMTTYFTASPALSGSCLPMFLSTFSHHSFFHLAANMYVLYSFSSSAVSFFGKEQFTALYLSSGVISSFTSYIYKVASGRLVTSLGASGSLMAILASICFQFPDAHLQIVFLPFFTFSAGQAIKCIMALDFVGLVAKWRLFDHAAHLGGALSGILYLTYGREYIWNRREPLFKWYHDIREQKRD